MRYDYDLEGIIFNMIRRTFYISTLLALIWLSVACASENAQEQQQNEAQLTALNVAMIPSQDSQEQEAKVKVLADYLQEQLGMPVKIEITENYDQAVDLLVEGKVNIAYLGPFAYVKARQRNDALEPIAAPIEKATGRPWYTSLIVAQRDIKTVEQLKGKRFSFVNPSSNSGYLAPSAYFKTIAVEPEEDFATVEYAGSHNKNLAALLSGAVDAITINSPTYLKAKEAGLLPEDTYNVLWESDPLPNAPIVINSKQFSPELKIELQKALINAPEGLVDGRGAESTGYTLVQDEDYEPIRRMQEIIEVESD